MLRRFADARLRSDLDKACDTREKLRRLARHLAVSLKEARAENARLRTNRDQVADSLSAVWDALGLKTASDGNAVDAIRKLRAELDRVRAELDTNERSEDARLAIAEDELGKARTELAYALHHLTGVESEMDRLRAERARTQETAGRCGDVAPSLSLLASRTRPTCRLPAGHPGWHRGDDDSEWTRTEETQP